MDDAVGDAKALNLASEMGGIFFGTSGDDGPPFLDAPAETVHRRHPHDDPAREARDRHRAVP